MRKIKSPPTAALAGSRAAADGAEVDPRPEIVCFRGQTLALVRHFFELSSQLGRLPSLLGREFFRARVTHHAIPSFEEQAVFVRDIELCFSRLSEQHAEIVTLIGLYSFSREEVAEMLHCSKAWVNHHITAALDALSEIFLQAGVLGEDRPDRRQSQVSRRSVPLDVIAASRRQFEKPAARKPVAPAVEVGGEQCQPLRA